LENRPKEKRLFIINYLKKEIRMGERSKTKCAKHPNPPRVSTEVVIRWPSNHEGEHDEKGKRNQCYRENIDKS
jgi:hypothetical protein